MTIGEPSGAEIPSGFGGRSKVAVKISRVSTTLEGRRDVLAIGLVARLSSVVPITIKNRSIAKPDHAAITLTAPQDRGAIHPILIFRFQLWKIGHIGCVALSLSDQIHHQRKKRRLRATEIVGPIPVRHVSIAVDLESEVFEHVERDVVAAVRFEAQHGEIGIPIVELTESATRHNVRVG
jgi:hypothetical protein